MKLIDILVEELPKRGGWPVGADYVVQDNDGSLDVKFGAGEATLEHDQRGVWVNNITPDWGIDTDESYIRDFKILAGDASTDIITREQYEAALAAKNEGWIEWGGGECPVEKGTLVDVKWRDGRIDDGIPAKISHDLGSFKRNAISWRHHGNSHDIIAYRLHQPQKVAHTEAEQEAYLNECIGQAPGPLWNGEGLPPIGCECEFISNDTSWGSVIVIGFDGDKVVIKPSGETYYGISPSERQVFRPVRSEAERRREEAVKTIMLTGWCQTAAEEIYDLVAAGKVPGMKLGD